MKARLEQELRNTMYLHEPLPLDESKQLEQEAARKKVLCRKMIWDASPADYRPAVNLPARLEEWKEEKLLRLSAPLRSDSWPAGAEENGNYSNFGEAAITFAINGEDWRGYNRLHFRVRPRIGGARVLSMNAAFRNEGKVPVPDSYGREGDCLFSLRNEEWNDCYWEFDAMPRDHITQIKLYVNRTGQETCMEERLTYEFAGIYLEQVKHPETEKGWACPAEHIVYSTAGYFSHGEKKAFLFSAGVKTFTIIKEGTGKIVYTGTVNELSNEKGTFGILDFSAFTDSGDYRISAGNLMSRAFPIGSGILEEPVWKALNFIFCERCGTPVPGKHQACHLDMIARHKGMALCFAGGWHDAGDLSQQAVQTGEVVHALCELALSLEKGTLLRKRLLEEAQWGLDHLLRTRFGDGYRATSSAVTRITNGLAGDMDDIYVRVHNYAFDNFLLAGVEACAAHALRETDPQLAFGSLHTAEEDYAFAEAEFAENGVHLTEMFEHTYNSGWSQYYALMSWSASCLYQAGGKTDYALAAVKWADRLLACQETAKSGCPVCGFFYRDERHEEIVHFNHQAREHQFMQALVLLCETQPDHENLPKWRAAMERYASYLKALMSRSEPYRMIPSGIYRMDEPEKRETFRHLHITAEYEAEKENYEKQLRQGSKVDENHVIRQFPIWFSFRGNNAVLLSQAKAASLLGGYFQDEELLQIGRDQLYWIWGRNPFAQSLQYGVGNRCCRQYAGFCGDTAGAIPVGIETLDNEDIPYWPQNVNATYKEVWMSSVGRFLLLAADYAKEGMRDPFPNKEEIAER